MPESNYSFMEGFYATPARQAAFEGKPQRAFDFDKAAAIIREAYKSDPGLRAEAGLAGDWGYTAGVIFENGQPVANQYTYLSSNWAEPTLMLTASDGTETEIACFALAEGSRFTSDSKWDDDSLSILGIQIPQP
jgi:hypothetical protein